MWINRTKNSEIKAMYFADKINHSSIYNRYEAWKNGKTLISVCSGAFTNDYTKPIGITVDNGTIINRTVENKMNGLVIVYPYGGIAVSDISEKNLRISNNYSSRSLDIRNEFDKNTFLKFAAEEQVTVFQTQLLIYDNVLKCKSNNEYRERRFLVIAKDKNGDILHIIFNIPKNVQLYNTANNLLNFFKNSGRTIVAMLNLDTGANDMMRVYRSNGSTIYHFDGAENKSISSAVNFISYYY
jgi:hypothetical protein